MNLWFTKREREQREQLGNWDKIDTRYYIQINKDPLQNQKFVITYEEKESEKEYLYLYIYNWITVLYTWNPTL